MADDNHVLTFHCDACGLSYRVSGVDVSCPDCNEYPTEANLGKGKAILTPWHRSLALAYSVKMSEGAISEDMSNEDHPPEESDKDNGNVGWEEVISDDRDDEEILWPGWDRWRRYGDEWPETRKQVLRRDDYECQKCGIAQEEHKDRDDLFPPGKGLHIHHLTPFREFDSPKEANRLENLVALCAACHATIEEPSDAFLT